MHEKSTCPTSDPTVEGVVTELAPEEAPIITSLDPDEDVQDTPSGQPERTDSIE